jgi:hypothetical protein
MVDTVVTLGGYVFSSWGVPEHISGGGRQRLAVHRLIGGARVIDAMGWDAGQIQFSGRLRGAGADVEIRLLETLARSGVPAIFSYWTHRYQVLVASLTWQFERYYEITYKIVLEVLSDLTQDAFDSIVDTLDDVFNADLSLLASAINSSVVLPVSLSSITTAQAQIGLLQDATPSELMPLASAVAATGTQLQSLQTSLDRTLPVGAAGGVGAMGDPADLVTSLVSQTANCQQLAAAVQGVAITSRMRDNLGTVGQ